MKKSEFLRCPFCAFDGITLVSDIGQFTPGEVHIEYYCRCDNCNARGPNDMSIAHAVDMWNLRRKEFPTIQEIDEL